MGEAVTVPGITEADLFLAAVAELGEDDPLPRHFLTTREYADRAGVSEVTAVRHFQMLMQRYGWRGRKVNIDGRRRWIVWREEDE